MSGSTKIEWCDATVNWWIGCTGVSDGCSRCYAERMAAPFFGQKWGPGIPRKKVKGALASLKALDRKAQRLGKKLGVFHNSMSDFFDNEVPDAWRMDAIEGMADTPNLIHLLLTKRIGNVRPYMQRDSLAFDLIGDGRVRLGITVCNQPEADRDVTKLLAVPAATRFISIEPMLGPVSFEGLFATDTVNDGTNALERIDWVIVGGESGRGARPMRSKWVRSIRNQCRVAGVQFLFKQWGEFLPSDANEADPSLSDVPESRLFWSDGSKWDRYDGQRGDVELVARVGKEAAGRLLDGREWNEFPK